jgi:NAD(P)H-flavin reductase
VDTELLKKSFALVAPQAGELAEVFYARLFLLGGEPVRRMFPAGMTEQRDVLLQALIRIITSVDDPEALSGYLAKLGTHHGLEHEVLPEHYPMVGEALLATLAKFAGDAWTPELEATWAEAYGVIADIMQNGAKDAVNAGVPRWQEAEVTSAERVTADVTILHARPEQPVMWRAGQRIHVQFPAGAPRYWQWFAPATLPGRRDIIFHVQMTEGALVAPSLALHAGPGDRLRLGRTGGSLYADPASPRPLLMIAEGSGVAPMLAIIYELAARRQTVLPVNLFFGAGIPRDLYAAPELDALAERYPWLTVTYAVAAGPAVTPGWRGEHGPVAVVAAQAGDWRGHDVLAAGPSAMAASAVEQLTARGVPAEHILTEDFRSAPQ